MLTENERLAVAAFPEIRQLIRLRDLGGWTWFPQRDDGELVGLNGVRIWRDYWSDAIRVRYVTDACAVRTDPDGHLVWSISGTLTEVVGALLELPPPGSPGAPRLVRSARWLP